MNKFFFRFSVFLFLAFGLFTQVFAQRPNASALTELLSAGSQAVTPDTILLTETFDKASAWEAFQIDNASAKVVKGVYRMDLKGKVFTWGLNDTTHTDVVIQAETLENSTNTNNAYGVICRASTDGSGYYFQISGDGYYSIYKYDGSDFTTLLDWAQSSVINQGQNRNKLTAVCVGTYLAFYANDQLLGEATDDSLTQGKAGFTLGGYADDEDVDISFDNTVIWSATGGGVANESGLPETLDNVGGKSEDAIAELEQLSVIPSGATFIFGEDYAFFTGRGNWFTPIASDSPRKNIVMGGQLTFTVGDPDQLETCTLMSHINTDSSGTATTYIMVGLSNSGQVFINDVFSESADGHVGVGTDSIDLTKPHDLLMVFQEDKASVYVDGKLQISGFDIDARAGTYGIALSGKGAKAKCEGRNLWAYQIPSGTSGDCTVTADRTVNKRSGPGTSFASAGQLPAGTDATVVGQNTGKDGQTWWKLDDDSWVRQDVVSETGDCSSVPTVSA